MDPSANPTTVMSGTRGSVGVSIAVVQQQLTGLMARIRGAARRSNRFSWLSWGFLFALYLGLVFGALVGVAYPGFGAGLGLWLLLLYFLPAFVLLALGLRELFLGRRESLEQESARPPARTAAVPVQAQGWTEMVQESQKVITHAMNETDFTFLPLCFGALGLGEFLGIGILNWIAPSGAEFPFVGLLIPIPFILLVWPVYRVARRWIGGYQAVLDRQVRELSRLESEFFWQFARAPPPQ